MKCPKCGYVSYEYLDACRKCSIDLVEFKKSLRLESIRPGDLDLSVVLVEQTGKLEHATAFDIDDDFFSAQTMVVEREESAEEDQDEFDISLDDDFTQAAPRASSRVDAMADETDSEDFVSFEEPEADDTSVRPLSTGSPMPPAAPVAPVDMIDMSDLEDLDDLRIDLDEVPDRPEPTVFEEDTLTMVRPPTPSLESLSDHESADLTFDLTEVDDEDAPPPSAPLETGAEIATDDPLEAELELELEEGEGPKPAEPAADLLIHLDEPTVSADEEEDRPKPS
jgi:hypothetical protein